MEAETDKPKWEGKATAKLHKHTAEKVWPLLGDFCSFDKWLPTIHTCSKVDGVDGLPGLVRYCAGTVPDGNGGGVAKWCHEKLIDIDSVEKCLSYEVLDNNMGFKSYKSTMKVMPIDGGDDLGGCKIEWSFLADPVEGLSFEDLAAYVDQSLQGMAKNMEKELEK
ncbi:hypothetical protein CDL12_02560 [Handroanthus impetiginosus]|uniref:Polyketide cyclase/dehydrase n=1 Tax=Handroanthus impetiginosus TaxID=429701 RepID=A0A2G9I4M5_9LAMI|nr:hypothetical protein CDL12_02560 [Handroanthus impetiginosus]